LSASEVLTSIHLGHVLEIGSPNLEALISAHGTKAVAGIKSIIVVGIHQVALSRGVSVPFCEFKGHRNTLIEQFRKRDVKFQRGNKKKSIDRLVN
jgi:hypothetical protein